MKLTNKTIVKRFAMLTLAVAGITGTTQAFGQEYVNVPVATVNAYQTRTPEDLQQLTAPLALYPDALLAQVFVASAYPNDVLAAAQYLQNGGDPNQAANFGWDASVQGLLQTPDVLNQLAGNVDYMNQLGDAFLNQQDDVFAAVQALRAKAQACGNLVTTDQCQVVASDNAIQILPTNPDVIYVPVYDPAVVYVTRRVDIYNPCITFGVGIRVGFWLHDDFDWHDHRVYVGNWGGDRPWWHADRADYLRNRPGVYVNNVTNVNIRSNTNIRNTTTAWNHDNRKAGPVHVQGPVINRITNVTNRTNVINRTNVTNRTNVVTKNTNVNTNRTKVNVNRTTTSVNHAQASNVIHTNRSDTTGRTQTQRTSSTINRTTDVSKKTMAVNHNQQAVQQQANHANVQTHTAQPNPVRQQAARSLPTHAPQSVATAQRTQTVNHSAAAQASHITQTVSHTASNAAASRTNDSQRSNMRHG